MDPKHSRKKVWFVYILRCADRSLYAGIARDVLKRLTEHRRGQGSKYVRSRLPAKLVYFEKYLSRSRALKREHEIKCWTRVQKLALIVNK